MVVMTIQCKLTLTYLKPEIARKIKDSLEVDNQNFLKTELSGDSIIAIIEAKSCMSLLHTLEDYISCLSTAENVLED